ADLGHSALPFEAPPLHALAAEVYDARTASGAVWRSLVMPGWGQLHAGHTGRGAAYMTLFLGLAGAAATSAVLANDASGSAADAHDQRAITFAVGAALTWFAALVDTGVTAKDHIVLHPEPLGAAP
ncbi:MAG: hypothetical protein KC620_17415, partial [Myxococcales bacterium]|nr:hypothetical protein [Myxococcales bacterium]